ncbi:ATPase AAA [Amedibacterium intestinale]|uniref:ATPase AAA n=1 Tax=Amedibacterium intestinale TaxID=2583452 RepID=A0A6N4TIX0_9FIRM|nr:AAA family ATPase [Amedibacterium intestinale]BBK22960.1 ATPase AAA [Amedibacterium intestinale]
MMNQYVEEIWLEGKINENSYLNDIPVVQYLKNGCRLKFKNNVTFFVGENGTGKSTILEAIAVSYGFNAEGGSKNFQFTTRETKYELAEHLKIARKAYAKDGYFLRSESFYNVASNIETIGVNGYGEHSLHELSHGESFLSLFLNRFWGKGLYILDEPEAALSPMRQMTLISRIQELVNDNSQFIISTHSPILLAYPEATIYEFSDKGMKQVEYKDTEIYQVYSEFLKCPERMLNYLLK